MPTTDLATGHIYDSHPLPGSVFPSAPGSVSAVSFLSRLGDQTLFSEETNPGH